MSKTSEPSDITVRGGLINVPLSTKPTVPVRHQPNTPINKKTVKPKADHKPYVPEPDPDTPDAPLTEPPPADPPPVPPPTDPPD